MKNTQRSIWIGLAVIAHLPMPLSAQETGAFVAGTAPDRRPQAAPVITQYARSDAWLAAARTGISEPYPPSLDFLKDQGGWFTPFTRPGMTGPYDIRGWHRAKPVPGN